MQIGGAGEADRAAVLNEDVRLPVTIPSIAPITVEEPKLTVRGTAPLQPDTYTDGVRSDRRSSNSIITNSITALKPVQPVHRQAARHIPVTPTSSRTSDARTGCR